jgi:hypothetical protein
MKKTVFIFFFLFIFAGSEVHAQFFMNTSKTYTKSKYNATCIGVKGGINFSSMSYTDEYLSTLPQSAALRPIGGLFIDFRITDWFYICPEFATVSRGLSMSYKYYEDYLVDYKINSRYLSFRIPLMFKITVSDHVQPYVFFSPDFGYNYGGKIRYKLVETTSNSIIDDEKIPMGVSNMARYNYAALVGIGIRFNISIDRYIMILKTDIAYSYSFYNTFSSYEFAHYSTATNINGEYDINGERYNRGVEFTVSLALPIKHFKLKKINTCPAF